MAVVIAKLFGKRKGSLILRVPGRIPISLKAFQYQFCRADAGESISAVFSAGVDFNFDSIPVSGIRGSAGNETISFLDGCSKTESAICFIICKLRYQIHAPGICFAHVI